VDEFDSHERLIAATKTADVLVGGFPCQDISLAGERAGIDGDRSGLWSAMRRAIGLLRPSYVIVENVPGLLSGDSGRWFGRVLGDLATLGYDAEWHCIQAADIGAPHLRDRVWIVAYTERRQQEDGKARPVRRGERGSSESEKAGGHTDAAIQRCRQGRPRRTPAHAEGRQAEGYIAYAPLLQWEAKLREQQDGAVSGHFGIAWADHLETLRAMDDGLPGNVDALRALGNAVVPQIPEIIGRAIMQAEGR
jgi:DNA (cytosine-5)-methyltransferase 1